jgi:hypothetical protein
MKGETLDTRPFRFCQKCWLFEAHERFLLLRSEETLQKRICRGGERNQLGLAIVYFNAFLAHICYASLLTISYATEIPIQYRSRYFGPERGAISHDSRGYFPQVIQPFYSSPIRLRM